MTSSVVLNIPDIGARTCTAGTNGQTLNYTISGNTGAAILRNKTIDDSTNNVAANRLRAGGSSYEICGQPKTGDILQFHGGKLHFGQPQQMAIGALPFEQGSVSIAGADGPIGSVLTRTERGLELQPTSAGGTASSLLINGRQRDIARGAVAAGILYFDGEQLLTQPLPPRPAITTDGAEYKIAGVPRAGQSLVYDGTSLIWQEPRKMATSANPIGANVIIVGDTQYPVGGGIPQDGAVLTKVGTRLEFIHPSTNRTADTVMCGNAMIRISDGPVGSVLQRTDTGATFVPNAADHLRCVGTTIRCGGSPAPRGPHYTLSTTSTEAAAWTKYPMQDIRINYIGAHNSAVASGASAMAIGESSKAAGPYSQAIGNGARATQENAMAIGHGVTADLPGAIVIGGPVGVPLYPIFGANTRDGTGLTEAADDADATAKGVPRGALYHSDGVVRVRR